MGKKSKKGRITWRWLVRQLMFGLLPWVVSIWAVMVLVTANNSAVLKAVPPRESVFALERVLKDAEKPGAKLPPIQRIRAKLILAYIHNDHIVKAREQFLTYKNWLDTNPNLTVEERIEMHRELSIIHTALGEFEPAVKEYSLILQELSVLDDAQYRVLKARYLNNRGVANFFLSQASKEDDKRKKYLQSSIDDFQASQDLVASADQSKAAPTKESSGSLDYLDQIIKENENCVDREMIFTPMELQP